MTATKHKGGSNCSKCVGGVGYNKNDFLEKLKDEGVYNENYDYSLFKYVNSLTKGLIVDRITNYKHLVTPTSLLVNIPLTISNAVDKNKYLINEFKKVHGDKYGYSKVNYINTDTKLIMSCPEHGDLNNYHITIRVALGVQDVVETFN